MRFKFWNRWKREKKSLSLREAKEMTEEWNGQAPYATNLGDLSTADNVTDEDIEHFRKKREKKTPILKIRSVDYGSYDSGDAPDFKAGGPISKDDMVIADNSYWLQKKHAQKLRGVKADFVIDDDVFVQPKITKGQCMGFKDDGSQCSRIVNTVYCWQHKKKRS